MTNRLLKHNQATKGVTVILTVWERNLFPECLFHSSIISWILAICI